MPEIDVTDVLIDSDIAGEQFLVWRREEAVNNFGRAERKTFQLEAFGNIQPKGDNKVIREDDFEAQAKTIEVTTTFRLRGVSQDAAKDSYKPDFVIWNGDSFVVNSIQDFSQYGAGYILAECTSENFVDQPPDETKQADV